MSNLFSNRRFIQAGLALLVSTSLFNSAPHITQVASARESLPSIVHNAAVALPTPFIANAGQTDSVVHFEVKNRAGQLFFTPDGVMLSVPINTTNAMQQIEPALPDDLLGFVRPDHLPLERSHSPQSTGTVAVQVSFNGANPNVALNGADQLPGTANFFTGSDSAKWRTNVPTYAGMVYHDLYPGIDLSYTGHIGLLKGTYTIIPKADSSLIRWHYGGAHSVTLNPTNGELQISTPSQVALTEQKPVAWQSGADGLQILIPVTYALDADNTVHFTIGDYDHTRPLVIDPGLVYSTYLGNDAIGYKIALDDVGNIYLSGHNFNNASFPTTPGIFQAAPGGHEDVFISKLNASGSALIYSTFLGGSKFDLVSGIAVDNDGNAYLTGDTDGGFPITAGAYQSTLTGSAAAFVTKLNTTGSALVYSTYLGGVNSSGGHAIALDNGRNAYIVGNTGDGFPTTADALHDTFAGGSADAFVSKLDATGSTLVYSTYLGGSSTDYSNGITVDRYNNVYVTGGTDSIDFPTTTDALQPNFQYSFNAFITEINLHPTPINVDTIGVYRQSNNTFYLRNVNTTGYADLIVQYAIPYQSNGYPIVGDWTGSGIDTIGLYSQTNGVFALRNTNTSGAADETFVLGDSGDQPISGRWTTSTGHDGVGVLRPSNGLIYLKNDLTTGYADYTMVLGIPGDVGVAGDWNGDGIDSPGVFRPTLATFFLTDQVTNGSVFGDYGVTLCYSDDQPIVGDWHGQGHDGVGVFRPTSGLIYLKNALTTGYADIQIVYGIPNDIPVAGHWGISSAPAPRNSVIVPNTAFPPATTATSTRPPVRLTQPSSYDG